MEGRYQSFGDDRASTIFIQDDESSFMHDGSQSSCGVLLKYPEFASAARSPASPYASSYSNSVSDISMDDTVALGEDTHFDDVFGGVDSSSDVVSAELGVSPEDIVAIESSDDVTSIMNVREALVTKKKVMESYLVNYREKLDVACKKLDQLSFAQKYIRFKQSKTGKNAKERVLILSKQLLSIKKATSKLRTYIKKANDRIFILGRNASLKQRRHAVHVAICTLAGASNPRLSLDRISVGRLSRFNPRDTFTEKDMLMLHETSVSMGGGMLDKAPILDEQVTKASSVLLALKATRRQKLVELKPLMDMAPRQPKYWDLFAEANKLNVSLVEQAQICYEIEQLLSDDPARLADDSLSDAVYASKIFECAGISGWIVTEKEIREAYKEFLRSAPKGVIDAGSNQPRKMLSFLFRGSGSGQHDRDRDSNDGLNYSIFGDENGTEVVDSECTLSPEDVSLIDTGANVSSLVALHWEISRKSRALDTHLVSFRYRLESECKKLDKLPNILPFRGGKTGAKTKELVLRLSKQVLAIKKTMSKLRSFSKKVSNRIFILCRNASMKQRRHGVHSAICRLLGAATERPQSMFIASQLPDVDFSEEERKVIKSVSTNLGGDALERSPVSDDSVTSAGAKLEELKTARRQKLAELQPLMDMAPRQPKYWDLFAEANKLNVSLVEQAQICYEIEQLLSENADEAISSDNVASDADYVGNIFAVAGVSGWVINESDIREAAKLDKDSRDAFESHVLDLIDYLKLGRSAIEDQLDELNNEITSLRGRLGTHFESFESISMAQKFVDLNILPVSKTKAVNEEIFNTSSKLKVCVEKANILKKLLNDYDDASTKASVWKMVTLANIKQTNENLESDLMLILSSDERIVSSAVESIVKTQYGSTSVPFEKIDFSLSEYRLSRSLLDATSDVKPDEAASMESNNELVAESIDDLLGSSTMRDSAELRYQHAMQNIKKLPIEFIYGINYELVESKIISLKEQRQQLVDELLDKFRRNLIQDPYLLKKACNKVNDCTEKLLEFARMAIELSVLILPASERKSQIEIIEGYSETQFAVRVFERAGVSTTHKLRPTVVEALARDVAEARGSNLSAK